MTKICSICKKDIPLDNFRIAKKYKNNRRSACKECEMARWGKEHNVTRVYGISFAECENILLKQNGFCAICGKKISFNHEYKGPACTAHIDHDHKDNQIRGVLCIQCNAGLGQFKDNPIYLLNAIKYLFNPTIKEDYKIMPSWVREQLRDYFGTVLDTGLFEN